MVVQSEPSLYYYQDVQGDLITEIYNQIDIQKNKSKRAVMFLFDPDNEEIVDKYLDSLKIRMISIKIAAIKENISSKIRLDRGFFKSNGKCIRR